MPDKPTLKVKTPPAQPDEIVRAAMAANLARWQIAFERREIQRKIKEEATAIEQECTEIILSSREACKNLGYDRDDKEIWDKALRLFDADAKKLYDKVRTPDLPDWDEVDGGDSLPDAKPERPSIKFLALQELEKAGKSGLKAADIRKYIIDTYGEEIHEKTVGMTLYRLSQEAPAPVRREGHTWFIAPKSGETKNPGG